MDAGDITALYAAGVATAALVDPKLKLDPMARCMHRAMRKDVEP